MRPDEWYMAVVNSMARAVARGKTHEQWVYTVVRFHPKLRQEETELLYSWIVEDLKGS